MHMYVCMQVYSVEVKVHTEQVLSQLLRKEQFAVARKYASIVNSTVSQVTVKEVSHTDTDTEGDVCLG